MNTTPTVRETIEQVLGAAVQESTETIFAYQRSGHNPMDKLAEIEDVAVDAILAVFKDVLGETLDKRSAEYKHLKNKLYKEAKHGL